MIIAVVSQMECLSVGQVYTGVHRCIIGAHRCTGMCITGAQVYWCTGVYCVGVQVCIFTGVQVCKDGVCIVQV